jgi:hypothetical protein
MSSQAANDLRTAYLRDGFAVVHRFVESEEIVSLQSSIADLATSVARSLGVPSNPLVFDHDLVRHWSETENLHPRFRASLYDAMKFLPGLHHHASSEKSREVFVSLMGAASAPLLSPSSLGFRIDAPHRPEFNAVLHQDAPFHGRSTRGIVFWLALHDISVEMGSPMLLAGSHRTQQVFEMFIAHDDVYQVRSVRVKDESILEKMFPEKALNLSAGDCLLIDYFTLHRSGINLSTLTRWSMQWRLFDGRHPLAGSLIYDSPYHRLGPTAEFISAVSNSFQFHPRLQSPQDN